MPAVLSVAYAQQCDGYADVILRKTAPKGPTVGSVRNGMQLLCTGSEHEGFTEVVFKGWVKTRNLTFTGETMEVTAGDVMLQFSQGAAAPALVPAAALPAAPAPAPAAPVVAPAAPPGPPAIKESHGFWFIRKDAFLKLPKGRCPRHQTLRAQGILEFREVLFADVVTGKLASTTIAVSHRWLAKNHFDPEGKKVDKIKQVLQQQCCDGIEFVWVDFLCLSQLWKDDGSFEERTAEEETFFQQSLACMLPNLFLGARIMVLWDRDYNTKFWPNAEMYVAMQSPTAHGLLPSIDKHYRPLFACMHGFEGQDQRIEARMREDWQQMYMDDALAMLGQDDIKVTNKKDKEVNLEVLRQMTVNLQSYFASHPEFLDDTRHATAVLTYSKRVYNLDVDIACINQRKLGKSALEVAVEEGKLDAIRSLLAIPGITVDISRINWCDSHGKSALDVAIEEGKLDAIRSLLAVLPSSEVNSGGMKAVGMGLQEEGSPAILPPSCMAQRGLHGPGIAWPRVEMQQARGLHGTKRKTPSLILAAEKGRTKAMELLLAVHGIDVNVRRAPPENEEDWHGIVTREDLGACPIATPAMVPLRVVQPVQMGPTVVPMHGTMCSSAHTMGPTALYSAVRQGHGEIVRLLLASPGIDVKLNYQGLRPYHAHTHNILHLAALQGQADILRMLLSVPGIEVNSQTIIDHNNRPQQRLGLSIAPACAAGVHGHFAEQRRQSQQVQHRYDIVQAKAKLLGHGMKAKKEEKGAEAESDSSDTLKSYSSLHLAALHGHKRCVELLLSVPDIDVNLEATNQWRPNLDCTTCHTALHAAAASGREEVVQAILAAPGIDLKKYTNFNQTTQLVTKDLFEHLAHPELKHMACGVPGQYPLAALQLAVGASTAPATSWLPWTVLPWSLTQEQQQPWTPCYNLIHAAGIKRE